MSGKHAKNSSQQFMHTSMIDEDYMVVGSHVDENTYQKIKRGEYIDFGKLVPKDRILVEEENRLELVMKGGQTYYVPIADVTDINSFSKWEKAFRVYSNIYSHFYPQRSAELIEYNHVIHTISMSYTWEAVYMYDKDFHIHMAKHPGRNWGIILQQAWALRFRDRPNYSNPPKAQHGSKGNSHNGNFKGMDEPCRHYNKGRCPFGSGCRYDHRCSYCFKFGHSVLNC